MRDDTKEFEEQNRKIIQDMSEDANLSKLTNDWMIASQPYQYSYHFEWMGLPIIQYPQDIAAMQEIIWQVKPDLIVETGVARGGSLIFYASMLELLGGNGIVVGIDIDIRAHNKERIENHPMFRRVRLIEGSSTDREVVSKVKDFAVTKERVIVVLDSLHTHEHVLQELNLYSPLVSKGSYLVVFDTLIDDMPRGVFDNRPWGVGNNPRTAVHEFLKNNHSFEIDKALQDKLLITAAPDGYLKRVGGE